MRLIILTVSVLVLSNSAAFSLSKNEVADLIIRESVG